MEAPEVAHPHTGRVVAIIQARTGSQRFPGKMLARLAGTPLVEWVLTRVGEAKLVGEVVLATTEADRDLPLVEAARALGVSYHQGPEEDVLQRFVQAADRFGADTVVRICADNPFIDAAEIDRLVHFHGAGEFDYSFNHVPRGGCRYPDGLGAEAVSAELLRTLAASSVSRLDHEHVTWSFWQEGSGFRTGFPDPPPDLDAPTVRFDVDHPEDLERLEAFLRRYSAAHPGADLVRTRAVEFVRFMRQGGGV